MLRIDSSTDGGLAEAGPVIATSLLRRAGSLREFFERPHGHWTSTRSFLAWCLDATLWGHVFWGDVRYEDLAPTVALLERFGPAQPYDLVSDFSRIERIDLGVFNLTRRYLVEHADRHRALLRVHSIATPPGFAGAVVAGFYGVVGIAVPWVVRHHRDPGEAFRASRHPHAAELRTEVERLSTSLVGVPPVLSALRAYLVSEVGHGPLVVERAASELGVSKRSLQRHLERAGTSFAEEHNRARVDIAKDLLCVPQISIEAVAARAGFASGSHLARVFGRVVGVTPTAYRGGGR